jgi:hypothetical protein
MGYLLLLASIDYASNNPIVPKSINSRSEWFVCSAKIYANEKAYAFASIKEAGCIKDGSWRRRR